MDNLSVCISQLSRKQEMRFELVSMDLYENQPIYDRQPFESTLSAGPIVIRQSFIFPATVSTWAVTSTHQGITYKQIIGMSRLVSSRRAGPGLFSTALVSVYQHCGKFIRNIGLRCAGPDEELIESGHGEIKLAELQKLIGEHLCTFVNMRHRACLVRSWSQVRGPVCA
jgi:hypothetical protein